MEAFENRPVAAPRRPRSLVLLHWITLVPLGLAFAAVLLRGQVEERALRAGLLWVHQCSGATVLVLGVLRLIGRWRIGPLPATAGPRWASGAAAALHGGLYLAMLVVPLLGWGFTTASGHLPPWGMGLPGLTEDEDLADRIGAWHTRGGYAWLLVIGLHVAAALWHHFVLRDGMLNAMRLQRSAGISPDRTPPA